MIEKMKFVTINGPVDDIDRFANNYLSKYEIHLENALVELSTSDRLIPFKLNNPYEKTLAKYNKFGINNDTQIDNTHFDMSIETATDLINKIDDKVNAYLSNIANIKASQDILREKLHAILPYRNIDFDIQEILSYEFVKFRFGRIPKEYLSRLEYYVYNDLDAVFIEGGREGNYIYGVYFAATADVHLIDSVFASLHFERMFMQDDYTGTPETTCQSLEKQIKEKQDEIDKINNEKDEFIKSHEQELILAKNKLQIFSDNYDIRRLAALTTSTEHNPFYILCGWMSESEADKLSKEADNDDKLFVLVENPEDSESKPPTKLKTIALLKPFQMFVKMYGLPSYTEMDPTLFIALTYTFIFGIMFGDVGQGLMLAILGFVLYKVKHINLAGIISVAGIFSTLFGFMFGSVFGFEDIIKPVWIKPISNMTKLPLVGKLNTIFIVTIAFGMGLIIIAIILNIINNIRAKKPINAIIDKNGIAGLVFYSSIVLIVFLMMSENKLPARVILIIMFVVPLIVMAIGHPIVNVLKKKPFFESGAGMFFVNTFFEFFEMLLSYFSNTISFVRIGAFAVSHAAMMEVVLMLAGYESGNTNWVVVVLGNLFVCGMEGLIVGIQVLRLEYYELFSRFYTGGGKEFIPYKKEQEL